MTQGFGGTDQSSLSHGLCVFIARAAKAAQMGCGIRQIGCVCEGAQKCQCSTKIQSKSSALQLVEKPANHVQAKRAFKGTSTLW